MASSSGCKHIERMNRLKELQAKRQESKKLNRAEMVEEDRKSKLPKNWENRQLIAEWKLKDIEKRKACEMNGKDYDREKLLHVSAVDADKSDAKKRRKNNADLGFSTFEEAGARCYQKLAKSIKPDMERYLEKKEEMGEELFYAGMNTLLPGQTKDSQEDIDRMVNDLIEQKEKRKKKPFSRRRPHDDSKDVDYINEGNARNNAKLERFYGKYTTEIKQNLERGTAV